MALSDERLREYRALVDRHTTFSPGEGSAAAYSALEADHTAARARVAELERKATAYDTIARAFRIGPGVENIERVTTVAANAAEVRDAAHARAKTLQAEVERLNGVIRRQNAELSAWSTRATDAECALAESERKRAELVAKFEKFLDRHHPR